MKQMMKKVVCFMLVVLLMLSTLGQSVLAKQNGKSSNEVTGKESSINQQFKEIVKIFQFEDEEIVANTYDELAIELFDEVLQTTTSAAITVTITDFDDEWDGEDGDLDVFFESNSLEELVAEYNSMLSEEYHYGVLLKSDRLFTVKHKLTILTKAYILSTEVSDETKGLLKDALNNMYQADKVVCKNGIENLEFFIETINHKGTKNSIYAKLKNAVKEFEKAEEFINKGLATPASKAYQKSYLNVLEGFGKGGIYFTDEYLLGDTDSDQDGLTDGMEYYVRTNPFNVDTDGDGLSDYQEMLYGLDPQKPDTDGNGILDIDEDLDGDGLSIGQELLLKTDPLNLDTDGDGLSDGDEVNIYFTDPLKADTDGDGLNDGDEIALGLNPLVQDTDGNGILDSEEKILQTLSVDIIESEKPEIVGVSVTLAGTGNLNTNTTIESVFGIDMLSSDVVGLIGSPVEIKSSSQFDEATIAFTYDDTLLGDTNEEDLAIMWYDEENNRYEIFDEESIIDTVTNTVSYKTTHFSTYLVVDKQKWYEVWMNGITYLRNPGTPSIPAEFIDISYVLDSSGSMSGSSMTTAKGAISSFIDAMYSGDRGSLVTFNSTGTVRQGFTKDKVVLKSAINSVYASGGTSVNAGLIKSIELFENDPSSNTNIMILLCDGDVNATSATIERAKNNNIKVYPVLIGSTWGAAALENIANQTGGTFYYAATAEDIIDAFYGLNEEIIGEIDTTDTDGDGLYDIYEISGMMLPNGKVIYTDPMKVDTDGDELSDGSEIGELIQRMFTIPNGIEIKSQYFTYTSNPMKEDSDGDGLFDGKARIVNGKKVAPIDPDKLKTNGPVGIWQEQYEQEFSGDIPNEYGDWYDIDWSDRDGWPSALTGLGSYVLRFRYDNLKEALHSDASNWQKIGGYNDVYDAIFRFGTNGNMRDEKFVFNCDGEDYVVWTWRGDYLNLGSGAEIGVYTNPHDIASVEHWDVVDFTLPMTLNLYNYYSKYNIQNILSWAPNAEQWWITGFNPIFDEPEVKEMVSLGTINFAGREDMFEKLKEEVLNNNKLKDFMIFDEDGHTVWLIWWEK